MTIIGFFALLGSFSAVISVVPQIICSYRTKSVGDISMGMIVNLIICSISWAIYGFLTNDLPLALTNCVTCVFDIILFVLKIRYRT